MTDREEEVRLRKTLSALNDPGDRPVNQVPVRLTESERLVAELRELAAWMPRPLDRIDRAHVGKKLTEAADRVEWLEGIAERLELRGRGGAW